MIGQRALRGKRGWLWLLAAAVLLLSGCSYRQVVDYLVPPPKEEVAHKKPVEELPEETLPRDPGEGMPTGTKQVTLVLFFSDDQSGKLMAEKRRVPKVQGLARRAIHELIKGPKTPGLRGTIPAGTKLLDINIKADGLCIVNFSKELRENHQGGSSGETLTVYSIVNTLTQFPTVKEVQFLIEGKMVDTLAGHLDLSQPLERDPTMIGEFR